MRNNAILLFLGVVVSAHGIVVEKYGAATNTPSGLNWNYVYNYKTSSAVAVGGSWILTAAHVADDGGSGSLSVGGTIYNQQEIIFHPTVDGKTPDLALVRYDKVFPGYYSLYTGSLPNLEVLLVGYGTTGTVHSDYWIDAGIGRGTRRWGSQEIDRTYTKTVDAGGTVGLTKTAGLEMDFILGSTTHEAGVGAGDSGGGVFYNDGGVWKLAGINVSVSGGGGQYDASFAAAMSIYSDWVMETIPEPVSMSLVGIGVIGMFLSRATRRHKLGGGRSIFPIRHEPMCDLFCAEEEEEAHMEECNNSLTYLKHTLHITLLSAWREQFLLWREGQNKVFWNHMVLVCEHGAARMDAIKSTLMNGVIRGLDAFLDKVTSDKVVPAFETRRESVRTALKRYTTKGLDAFLDKIAWDKVVSAYETRKNAVTSAIKKAMQGG